MNKNMKIFLAFLVALCLLVGGIAVLVWSGGYNVGGHRTSLEDYPLVFGRSA